jgi:hypothetical protein
LNFQDEMSCHIGLEERGPKRHPRHMQRTMVDALVLGGKPAFESPSRAKSAASPGVVKA